MTTHLNYDSSENCMKIVKDDSLYRTITIPEDVKPGDYVYALEVRYKTGDTFKTYEVTDIPHVFVSPADAVAAKKALNKGVGDYEKAENKSYDYESPPYTIRVKLPSGREEALHPGTYCGYFERLIGIEIKFLIVE